MVQTLKFSEFAPADLTKSSNTLVGVSNGLNARSLQTSIWTTATRPSPPFNGLLGYNADLSEWEYWNGSTLTWVQFLTSSSGENWSEITTVSVNASINSGYIANRTVTPVNIVLPAIMNFGDSVLVMGKGTAGWSLIANAGQIIHFGDVDTSIAGSISSSSQYDNIQVRCITPNLEWEVWSVFGNPTYL